MKKTAFFSRTLLAAVPRLLPVALLIAAMSAMAIDASAQRFKPRRPAIDTTRVVIAYTDSLQQWLARADSTAAVRSAAGLDAPDGSYYPLFAPLTFYRSTTASALQNDSDDAAKGVAEGVDRALMNVYLHRPDLVVSTEQQIAEAGSLRNDIIDKKLSQDFDLTESVAPAPEEPDIAPAVVLVKRPNFWTFKGDSYLQFLQNYVSENWYKGGESNYSMIGNLVFEANYNNKSRLKFENKLELKLGFQTSRDDTLHKFKTNNDLIRYTGKLGLQAKNKWYYSLQVIANTQFTRGLKSNDKKVYSDFMSPFKLSVGLGMEYSIQSKNKKLNGSVNISALAFSFVYVDRKNIANSHGVTGNHHSGEDFGSQLTADLTWTITDQIKWKTRFYAYTTYRRTLMEWENTITLAVSKYISTNIFLYPRFDDAAAYDDDFGYWQFKEYCSLGFSYAF